LAGFDPQLPQALADAQREAGIPQVVQQFALTFGTRSLEGR
jgi:hypothetical protein